MPDELMLPSSTLSLRIWDASHLSIHLRWTPMLLHLVVTAVPLAAPSAALVAGHGGCRNACKGPGLTSMSVAALVVVALVAPTTLRPVE